MKRLLALALLLSASSAAGGPAEEAGKALAAGATSEALRIAAGCSQEERGRCALVAGRALLQSDPAAAAAALEAAQGGLGVLEPHGRALLGEALLLSRRPQRALAVLREAAALDPDGPAGARARALASDALLDAGDPQGAASAAQEADVTAGPEVRANLLCTRAQALARIAAGLAQAAARPAPLAAAARKAALAARAFWLEHPEHPCAEQAQTLELQLARLSPGGSALQAPTPLELVGRAHRLLNGGQPGVAAAQLETLLPRLSGALSGEAALLFARALQAAGRRGEMTKPLERAFAAGDAKTAAAAGLLLARDRARHGDLRGGIAVADQLARRLPRAEESLEARYLAARLALEIGQTASGERRLAQLARGPTTAPAQDARWALAWLAFRKNAHDAASRFAAFARGASSDEDRAQGLYWQGRAAHDTALFARAAALDPVGYYGALARTAMRRPVPAVAPRAGGALVPGSEDGGGPPALAGPPGGAGLPRAPSDPLETDAPVPFPRGLRPAPPTPEGRLATAAALADLGLLTEAAAEVERHVQEHRGRADVARALPLFERCRRFDRSMALAQQLLPGAPPALQPALLEAAYPVAYPELVGPSAARVHLDPWFVLSIARRESAFRLDARSGAGALGLLQLLPTTAARIAAVQGRPSFPPEELADASLAIDLATWYLAELWGRFGEGALAAAAYNAGPRAAKGWAAKGAGEPLDVWVEEIPYRETRRYVKVVVGAWAAYRLLAGAPPPALGDRVPASRAGAEF